jgi:Na+-translocating ferredoxin:NAD+ oxidoreductase RNF subunit RnfB
MSILVIVYSLISMAVVAYLLGLGLVFASKKFAVEKDERIVKIEHALPNTNCGSCGVPGGCSGYAEGLVLDSLPINLCKPGGQVAMENIASVLGMNFDVDIVATDARVHCKSGHSKSLQKYEYNGILDCVHASTLYGGSKVCEYGCLGLGSCIRACPFDAIRLTKDGVAKIIQDKCTACGKCLEVCPTKIIHLIPVDKKLFNGCSSNDKGGVVRKYCGVGCIGCMKCEKACPADAIHVKNFLAEFDHEKCINCNKCFEVCPTGCIRSYILPEKKAEKQETEV